MSKNKDSMVLSISLVDIGRDEMNKHESDLFDSLPGEAFVICNRKPEKKKDKIKRLEKEIEELRIGLNNQRLKTKETDRKLMLEIVNNSIYKAKNIYAWQR